MYAQRKKLRRKNIPPNCFILNDPQGENNILPHPLPQMYAPNPYCAYIPCSIIIETRPEEGMQQKNQSFFVYCVEIEFRNRSPDRQVDSSLSIRSDAIRQ